MKYREKKYVKLPIHQDFGQMQENSNVDIEHNEYEQMHFEVNSIYEEVNNQIYPGYSESVDELNLYNQEYQNQSTNHMMAADTQNMAATQEYYVQIQEMYEQANQQSFQNGYNQGYQECYGQVYEQAYNQAYQIAYQQAHEQAQPMIGMASEPFLSKVDIAIGQMESIVGQVNNAVIGMEQKIDSAMNNIVATPPVMEVNMLEVPVTNVTEESITDNTQLPAYKDSSLEDTYPEEVVFDGDLRTEIEDEVFQDNDDESDVDNLQTSDVKQKLESIAREEYKNDLKIFVGNGGKSYIRKFAKMNETKQFLNWNFPAFLLGPIWYAYRKMPLMSLALTITMVLILSTENGLVAAGILMLLVGALSDKIYKAHVDRLLDTRFMMEEKEQINHQKLRGGVSVIYALTLIIVAIGFGVYTTEVLIHKSDFLRGIYDNLINLYYQFK